MANNQISEQELQFRKRARRRLVGAVALVLLMVTVLPMILDDKGAKTPQPEIAISIPSQDDANFTSRITREVPKATAVVPAAPVADATLAAPVAVATPLAGPQVAPQASTQAATKPNAAPAQNAAPVLDKPEVAVPVAVDKAAESLPAVADPEASVTPAPASKPLDAATSSIGKKGTFFVQIGVFAESPQFKKLEAKLKAMGLHQVREKLDTPKGPKIRLRVGSYPTRTDAETVLDKLKSADIPGMIVASK